MKSIECVEIQLIAASTSVHPRIIRTFPLVRHGNSTNPLRAISTLDLRNSKQNVGLQITCVNVIFNIGHASSVLGCFRVYKNIELRAGLHGTSQSLRSAVVAK